jgi:hypothetical protein
METIKKYRYYSILLLLWSFLLFFLTPFVFLFIDENVEVSKTPIVLHGDTVNYAIDFLLYYDNIISTITIDGWAFVETKQDNPDKYVKLIFVSDNVSYEIDTDLHYRSLQRFFKDKNVPIERNGFSAEFSPLIMKNGDYTLFINVFENDENFGFLNTGRVFRKYFRTFKELEPSELVDIKKFLNSSVNNSITKHVDSSKIVDEKFEIWGWAFLENAESSEEQIYLEIQKPDGTITVFSTKKMFREGVGDAFNDDRYNYSGFYAQVPLSALGKGDNLITILIGTTNRDETAHTFYWDGTLDE